MIMLEFLTSIPWWLWIIVVLALIAIRDIFIQRRHTISHNFPIVGHFRYMLERIGPELRQYIVANNREELPFNRSQRRWIYTSAKKNNNYEGFGSDQDFAAPNYPFVRHALLPFHVPNDHINSKMPDFVPCAKVIGLANGRKKPYRPHSVVNISAMSYGSLSARAIESLNIGAMGAGSFHNTGEGGVSPYHLKGSDVVFQIGTAYFGIRDEIGNFSMEKLSALVEKCPQIKAIEIKLSQGAKPGKGGVLPASKITPEISEIRGVPMHKDVISPNRHSAFNSVEEMLDLIELIAEKTGLPVGIKAAVGRMSLWHKLAAEIKKRGTGPDFITIDGGEGGTGAAPPAFANHVSLPFIYGFSSVYKIFKQEAITDKIVFIASGRLGLPAETVKAFAMGADLVNVAREAMLSIGCIQAQKCHNNTCPSGVATQNKWLQSGINVKLKSKRVTSYLSILRKEVLDMSHACGYEHPCQFALKDVDLSMGDNNYTKSMAEIFGYEKELVPFEGMETYYNCEYLGSKPVSLLAKN